MEVSKLSLAGFEYRYARYKSSHRRENDRTVLPLTPQGSLIASQESVNHVS